MAIQINDEVYVKRTVLGLGINDISPYYRTTVRQRQVRSVLVDLPDGTLSVPIATSKIDVSVGVLIIRIGDFHEDGLLDPLAKSLLHYLRIMLPPDFVNLIELRTENEFSTLWDTYHALCKQVVLVGHGSGSTLRFGNVDVTAGRFVEMFQEPNPEKKEVISLACLSGQAAFAKSVSGAGSISHFVAPFHSIHGCVGSLFAATYLNERILADYSAKVAFNHARRDLAGAATFRLWDNGKLVAGQKK
ncbi:MAG: hypothetical protein KF824_11665 [Fimbriimonadaceae bacterium]|nr:MAG: hypothetical protein KF824_11665 [Fimbriimonadaceae bacterium]